MTDTDTGARMISAFQAGHGWVASGSGSQADDTSDFVVGTQSLALTPPTNGSVQRTTLTIAAVDLSDRYLGMRLRVGGTSRSLVLRVASGNIATDYAEATVWTPDVTAWIASGSWDYNWLARGMFAETGTVDWSAIRAFQFGGTVTGAGGANLKLGSLFSLPDAPTGVVSITCDDGLLTQYTIMREILSTHEMPATAQIIADVIGSGRSIDSRGFMSLDQLHDLQTTYGWEIAAHAYLLADHNAADGFASLTAEEAEADFAALRAWLSENGFRGGDQFAWPKGIYYEHGDLARKYFGSGTSVNGGFGPDRRAEAVWPHTLDRFRVRRWSLSGLSDTVGDIRTAIDQCVRDRTWLILCFHHLLASGSPSAGTDFRASDARTVIDYLAASGLPVLTVGQALHAGPGSPTDVEPDTAALHGLGAIVYDGDVGAARPPGYAQVQWVLWPSEPTNMVRGDIWIEVA
jgi:peptidoglycan/xylan/chitin deacetylase (PgdA/CDA1 family)